MSPSSRSRARTFAAHPRLSCDPSQSTSPPPTVTTFSPLSPRISFVMFELYINRILHHHSFTSCFYHLNLCLRDASTAHVAEFIFLFAVLHGNLFIMCYILKYAHVLWIRDCSRHQGIQRCAQSRPCAEGIHSLRVDVKPPTFPPNEVSH